jgi:mannose-6-phosphate isomerase
MESSPLYSKDTPWGKWEVLVDSDYCKVKRIIINQNKRLSYQTHTYREETWMIVKGIATVVLNDTESTLNPGDSIFIEKKAAHRIGNFGKESLIIIEIQRGDYFGEDDIIRLQDDFGR